MLPDEIFSLILAQFPEAKKQEGSYAILVAKEQLLSLAKLLKVEPFLFDELHCLTAIDWKEAIELVYIFISTPKRHELTVKVKLDLAALEIESLTSLWKSADWFERETYDLFGVRFLNHPNLKRILNPDDWAGYPLRKDYTHPNLIPRPKS